METHPPHKGAPFTDPLFRTLVGTTLGLGTLFGVLIVFWGAGPVLFEAPSFISTTQSFLVLAAFSVAFLAFGRYHVLHDPTAYWIGTAYAAFGILSIFFILTWPGLLPSGRGLLAQLPNTSGWIALLELSSLSLLLLAALLGEWPGAQAFAGRRWVWSVGAWLLVITLLASLAVIFEHSLPLLVGSQGNLTPLLLSCDWVFIFLFAVGAVLSTRRYLHAKDKLLGYVALTQIVLAFVVLTALIGARRYDLWYYLSRLLLVGGFLTMMFGLLAEYVGLFRRERDKTREVQVRSAELLGILQSSPDAVFVTDEQGGIRYASQKALDLLRVDSVADLSRPVADWAAAYKVSDRTGQRLLDEELPLARVARGETIQGEEVQFRDLKRGGAIWLLVSGGPLTDERGQRLGGLLVGTDITERKQAEMELQHAKEAAEAAQRVAEAANRAKSDFLAKMSHELRTPLNAILGYTQIFQRDQTLTPKQQAGIEIMHQSGQYLLQMITDLLDLTQVEAGKLELHPGPVSLPHFLKVLTEMVRGQAEPKGLAFSHQLDPTLPGGVYVDERRLREVLWNLLNNAIKYTQAGRVELSVAAVSPPEESGVGIRFQVSDTGSGIVPEALEEIFSPFYQVGGLAASMEGIGLGLTISRHLVDLLGGKLQVESTPGRGSTFWFDLVLPVALVEDTILEETGPPPSITGFNGGPVRILIVDDRFENRTMLREALTPLGFTLVEAANGQEAVQQALATPPDLILMDLVMPVMDGFAAIRHIRRESELEPMPIIALSATANGQAYEQSKKAGADVFLTKPIRLDDLFTYLATHLKLEWRYDQPPAQALDRPAERRDVILPSPEELRTLRELAQTGFMTGLEQRLAQISQADAAYQPFVEQVSRWVDQLEFEEIVTLIDQYLERRES